MSVTSVWVIDQINEPSAAVEVDGGSIMTVPTWILPEGVQEGDVFRVRHERQAGRVELVIEHDAEEQRRRLARSKAQVEQGEAATSKNTPGDIVL